MGLRKQNKVTFGDLLGRKQRRELKTRVVEAYSAEADGIARLFVKAKKRIQGNGVKYKSAQLKKEAILRRVGVLIAKGKVR